MSVLKLIGFLAVGLLLFLAVLMRLAEGGCDAFAEFKTFWRSRGRFDKVVLAALASLMISFAGAKHGGTNGVDQIGGAATNEPPPRVMALRPFGSPAWPPPALPELPGEITSDAIDLGLVLVGVGTNETHDFEAPASAASVTNWLAHGAATDWFKCRMENEEFKMPFGTNEFTAMTILADGAVYPFVSKLDGMPSFDLHSSFSILHSSFGHGVVPVANWGKLAPTDRPSRVWYGRVGDGAFAVTWQNVLLGRDLANPVSFQLRLHPDGAVVYRYDLSRLADDSALTNAAVAVANGGASFATGPISRNLTSLKFARLTEEDRTNPDRDGDGLSTADELFVHRTDPSLPDSDFDGLSDFDELFVHHTDPLDPNSLRTDVPDGMAVVMGNEDPFAFPEGSTNTVFEHVFYTGTTNAPFAYPSDSDGEAVLKVTVRGSGAGRLVVGDLVVPLLARPRPLRLRSANGGGAPDPTEQTVFVRFPKGVRHTFWGSLPPSLQAEVDSGSYTIGRLPRWYTAERGWVAFPNTKAKAPCIHDLGTGGVDVSLDPGAEITGLVCTWNEAANVEVENRPPLAARLTGRFPHGSTTPITYTLDHPDYLFGEATYTQTARFCPSHSDDCDDGGIPPAPVDSEYGDEEDPDCSCWYGVPCGNPWCSCGCSCCGGDEDDEDDAPPDVCPIHECHYVQCEHLHYEAYTNGIASATNDTAGILRLDRDPPWSDPIQIRVPDTFVRCCPCPDHWTNYVALAAKSYNLAVRTADGERFTKAVEDCTVHVSGLAPSFDFDDSSFSLCKTGVVYETRRYTVLGLGISHPKCDLDGIVRLNPGFGLPVVASASASRGTELLLRTDIDLPVGEIRLEFDDTSTNRFQLYLGDARDGRMLLLDTQVKRDLTCSLKLWRRLTRDFSSGRDARVTLVAFGEGTTRLKFSYAAAHDGRTVSDCRELTISAVLPPLVPDFDRDGDFDDDDARLCVSNRFHFWNNGDIWKNDDAFDLGWFDWITGASHDSNGDDSKVNGRNDLVNLLPLAIRSQVFREKWRGHQVGVVIRSPLGSGCIRRCYADVPWNASKRSVLDDVATDDESSWWQVFYDNTLHASNLRWLTRDALSESVAARCENDRGVVLVESRYACESALEIAITVDGVEVLAYRPDVAFSDVDDMYRWHNIRGIFSESGASDFRSSLDVGGPPGWPDSQRDDAHLFFVHGYNVSEREAREWGRAMFKRLWWSGMNAKFHVVTWYGNDSQFYLPEIGLVTPNYHVNVEHAFASSSNLVAVAEQFSGRKYFIAHSLGNMLVSSAIQDWNLPHDKYMLLNAAVPIEAYDTSSDAVNAATIDRMTPREWVGYDAALKAANWHTFFDVGDGRRKLTWKGRFSRVVNVVSYYSSEEDVLRCGNGEWHQPLQRAYAWYNQERIKGVKPFETGLGRNEGGWGFNAAYYKQERYYDYNRNEWQDRMRVRTPAEANPLLTDATVDFKSTPFFGWFDDRTICTNIFLSESAVSRQLQTQLLADAIPAESLPAGLAAVPCWNGEGSAALNMDMATEIKNASCLNLLPAKLRSWGHSYFLKVPYMVVHGLFEDINTRTKENSQ